MPKFKYLNNNTAAWSSGMILALGENRLTGLQYHKHASGPWFNSVLGPFFYFFYIFLFFYMLDIQTLKRPWMVDTRVHDYIIEQDSFQ